MTLCQQMSLTLKGFLNIQARNKFQVKTQHRTLSEKRELQAIAGFEAKP